MTKRQSRWQTTTAGLFGVTLILGLVAGVFLVSGCGELPSTTAPGGESRDALQYADQLSNEARLGKVFINVSIDESEAPMGGEGGSVGVTLAGDSCTLVVPPDAVDGSVTIVMDAFRTSTPWGEVTIFDFGPDGLRFEVPANLDVECNRPDGTDLHLYWWNPDTGIWEYQQSDTVKSGKVEFDIDHFSKYGIS